MEEKAKHTLYIPQGIKTKKEIFDGFTKAELWQALIGIGVMELIVLIYYLISGSLVMAMIFAMSAIAAGIMFTVKDNNNLSVVDLMKHMIRFSRSQKQYPYVNLNEWERRY